MKHKAPHFLSVLMVLSFAQIVIPQCDAHVLVYRVKLMSGTKEDAGGIRQESWPSSLSTLSIIDLDTDFVETTDGTEKRGIRLDEKRGLKSFQYRVGKSYENSLKEWGNNKFEFYGKNNSKFYLFAQDFKDFGDSGVDHGAVSASGTCNLNVDIGGNRKSSVPKNFTATQFRGDSNTFKKNIFKMEYDPVITKAVNGYLNENKIFSTKGSRTSVAGKAAYEWLAGVYLPKLFPEPFPSGNEKL